MKFRLAGLSLAIALAGCTTTSTMSLAPDLMILTTRGNAFTAPEMVIHDVLLRSAQEAQARGYAWFVVESSQDMTTSGTIYMPAQGSAQVSGNASGFQGSSNYTGAQVIPFSKPGAQVTVRFGNGPRPANTRSFVAAEVISLNPKK